MPKFVIERQLPGAGRLTPTELRAIAATSCNVLNDLGPRIQWRETYVTDDKLYCVYIAPDAELIRAHAQQGGFPANVVAEVHAIIDPTTAASGT